jgi:hypothetical protein
VRENSPEQGIIVQNGASSTLKLSNLKLVNGMAGSSASEISADFAALTELVASDFLGTLLTVRQINLQTIAKNIVVFVTIGE